MEAIMAVINYMIMCCTIVLLISLGAIERQNNIMIDNQKQMIQIMKEQR